MKRLLDEIRLYLATWLLGLAVDVAPLDHPEGKALLEAAHKYVRDAIARRER